MNVPSFLSELTKWIIENNTRMMQASFRCVSLPHYTCMSISDSHIRIYQDLVYWILVVW